MKTIKNFFNKPQNKDKLAFLFYYIAMAVALFGIQFSLMWIGSKFVPENGRTDVFAVLIWCALCVYLLGGVLGSYDFPYNMAGCLLAFIGMHVCVVWYSSVLLLAGCAILFVYSIVQLEHSEAFKKEQLSDLYLCAGLYVLYSLDAYFAMSLMNIKPAMTHDEMYILLAVAVFIGLRPLWQREKNFMC